MKTKTLEFELFYKPDETPTCTLCLAKTCKFLLFRSFGQIPVCGFGEHQDLERESPLGFINVSEICPLHTEK